MNHAYSALHIKSIDDSDPNFVRLKGVASTPSLDRMGDSVNPLGAKFKTPMPLLWQHRADKPVGHVTFAKPSKSGIPFEAQIPVIKEAGALKDRIDEAIQSLRHGLVMCVSIGFNVLNDAYERLKETGGYLINEWEWLELSLVTIPAHPDAVITSVKGLASEAAPLTPTQIKKIKSIDEQQRAALGPPGDRNRPGASGQSSKPPSGGFFHTRSQKGKDPMKTLKELRELRNTKAARLDEIEALWADTAHEKSDDERAELGELVDEVKSLDDDILMAQIRERKAANATPVEGRSTETAARSRVAGGMGIVKTQDPDDKFEGQSFTRMAIAKAMSYISMREGEWIPASEIAQKRWGKTHPKLVGWIKSGVAGGGTGSGEWGAELAQSDTRYNGDFIEYLNGQTVFFRVGFRPVPANIHIKGQDGKSTAFWVGQSKGIPVTTADFSDVELRDLDVGAIAVMSKKLVRDASPSAEMLIRDALVEAGVQRIDMTAFSADAASAGVSPAGLLNGLSALSPSGTDADAVRNDLMSLYQPFLTSKNASGLKQIMTPSMAKALQLMRNSLGQREFPDIRADGGTLEGDPVLTGDNITGGDWILLKPSDIWMIGDTGVEVSMSDQATIEQDTAPTGASDTPSAASATLMSLWQTNSVGFKMSRSINYAKRRTGAVVYLANAEYGGVVS